MLDKYLFQNFLKENTRNLNKNIVVVKKVAMIVKIVYSYLKQWKDINSCKSQKMSKYV